MTLATVAQDYQQSRNQEEFASIDAFLQHVEKKGYRMALLAVGQHADAIDILQDAMLKLVKHYLERPSREWKPLFYRILSNRITDWQRQQQKRKLFFFWKSSSDEEDGEPLHETIADVEGPQPVRQLDLAMQQESVLQVLQQLPVKQQQCFLLRSWEGLSVAETADVMGCSQGSVKTHYFRAVQKLKTVLEEHHDVSV